MAPATVNFWFEFVSPYSMISALRLFYALNPKHAPAAAGLLRGSPSGEVPDLSDVNVVFRPISLGAVFKAAGQIPLPIMAIPIKGKYMFHDVARSLNALGQPGFPLTKPASWPPNSTVAGRMTWMLTQGVDYVNSLNSGSRVVAASPGQVLPLAQTKVIAEFVWRVYETEFMTSEDIGSPEVIAKLWDLHVCQASKMDGRELPDGQQAVALAQGDVVKAGFKSSSQEAINNSLFGAPSFTTEDGDMYWGNDRLFEALVHRNVQDASTPKTGFSAKNRGANL
ncbi:hypothetical protein GGI20_003697 [Coemansia sp. BCRC 34301]|nr:hypothetical protein GGI20_003697 [Coemansia sp. BCRC 34301]